jgi:8-oxo-dGTP diphosphatase
LRIIYTFNTMQNIKIAVDAVVFGYKNNQLNIVLIEQKFGTNNSYWALPGGLVKDDEPLIEAVKRELKEETGLSVNYLEQLFTFGDDVQRDSRNRVVSVAYFALINSEKLIIKADTDADNVRWFPIQSIPKLAFDHNLIIEKAFLRLQSKLMYQPIGFDLLPNYFLFSELENLYCVILEKEIDRRNFRKKMLSFGIIEQTETIRNQKSGRPAKLFHFNHKKYNQLVETGFHFEIKFA